MTFSLDSTEGFPGYYLRMPENLRIYESRSSYGIDSFFGEFGGWTGLLTGIAILSVVTFITDLVFRSFDKFQYLFLSAFKIGLFVVAISLVIFFTLKFLSKPKGVDVTIEPLNSSLELTFCSYESRDEVLRILNKYGKFNLLF